MRFIDVFIFPIKWWSIYLFKSFNLIGYGFGVNHEYVVVGCVLGVYVK